MKKNLKRKLVLARSTIRVLTALDETGIVGGISGPRICHTIDDICVPQGTGGATCNDTSEGNCHTGVVSNCLC